MLEVEVEFVSGKGKSTIHERLNEDTILRKLVADLSSKYETVKDILGNARTDDEIVVLINGRYPSNGMSTRLNHRDKITFVPLATGG